MRIGSKHIGIGLLLLAGALAGGSMICTAGNSAKVREKARYYFVEGQRHEAQSDMDAALHLYKKAYDLDPSYVEASYRYGRLRLQIRRDTFQTETEVLRSFSMLKPYVEAFPDDADENIYYGYVAGQLDSIEEADRVLNRVFARDKKQSKAMLYLSEAHAANGNLLQAADALSRYEKVEGKNYNVSLRKMSYYLNAGDTAEAIHEANMLIETNPADASFRVLKGNLYEAIQKPDSAVLFYQEAEKLDPDAGAPKLAIADYYRAKGDSVAYDNKIYELLLSEDYGVDEKTDLLAQYLQILLYDKNDVSRGDYLFSVLNDQYPHEPRLLDLSSRFSAAKGDFTTAAEQISYALDMQPDNTVMWGQLMTYQAGNKQYAEAMQTYERAKEHVEPDLDLKNLYWSVALSGKEYQKAIDMLSSIIHDIDPGLRTDTLISLSHLRKDITLAELDQLSLEYTSLADVYHESGNNTIAYILYENAELLNPDNASAYNNHAYFMSLDGLDLDKAESMSRKAVGKEKENPTYIDTLAWILYLKGRRDEAEETQRKAIEIIEKSSYPASEIYDHFGDILLKNGKESEAAAAWQKALKTEPENADEIRTKLNKLIESGVVPNTNSDNAIENE
jgi:tetratricopeptide (TPR) repeat protein